MLLIVENFNSLHTIESIDMVTLHNMFGPVQTIVIYLRYTSRYFHVKGNSELMGHHTV